jgi:alkanesulfonate monooxygenase
MPVRIIGMIGVTPPANSATLLVIEGAISPSFIVDFAQAHEAAGFDMALVGYTSSSAEGCLVAMHAAAHTQRLSYLVAHRPGFVRGSTSRRVRTSRPRWRRSWDR